jgi:hypothetical protein
MLAGDLMIAIRIPYLYVSYPGLRDVTAGPVNYWPSLEVEISTLVLLVTVPVCLATLIPSILSFRRQRISCAAMREQMVAPKVLIDEFDLFSRS